MSADDRPERRYDVSPERRAAMIDRIFTIVMSGRDFAAVTAFRSILEAEKLDLMQQQIAVASRAVKTMEAAPRPEISAHDVARGLAALAEAEVAQEPKECGELTVISHEEEEDVA